MGLFDGIENVADINKRIEGKSYLEFAGVTERNHPKDTDKRMVIFNYVYVGPDEDFEHEKVSEFFTFYKDMSPKNLKNYPDREATNAKRAVKAMCSRLMDLGFPKDEVDAMTADPEEKVGVVLQTNVYYNKADYLQIGNAKLMEERATQQPSDSNNFDDLLG